jgi:hypothetical protein
MSYADEALAGSIMPRVDAWICDGCGHAVPNGEYYCGCKHETFRDGVELADPATPLEEFITDAVELSGQLTVALGSLLPREIRFVFFRYGLGGGPPHTLSDCGDEFGISREEARDWWLNLNRKMLNALVRAGLGRGRSTVYAR